jgi:PilZ domain
LGNSLAPLSPSRKFSARVALVDLEESSRSLLNECFRQFGIDTVWLAADKADRLAREKFEACVVHIGSQAAEVLESARNSRSNSRMVIYGVGGTLKDVMKLSRYGINAIFNEPLERPAALKLVRATQMLVLHEFRRYVRIPVITQVSLAAGSRRLDVSSHDVSSGGMSLRGLIDLGPGAPVEVTFSLLTLPRVWVRGTVSWIKPSSKMFAVRFDPRDDRRLKIKEWVDSYIEN